MNQNILPIFFYDTDESELIIYSDWLNPDDHNGIFQKIFPMVDDVCFQIWNWK